jgi:hypothetical protein
MENSLEQYDIEKKPVWIGKNEFPFVGKILSAEKIKGRYGIDVRIELESDKGDIRNFDLWGANLNAMVNIKGPRFAAWMGERVCIQRTEDLKRVLSFVL